MATVQDPATQHRPCVMCDASFPHQLASSSASLAQAPPLALFRLCAVLYATSCPARPDQGLGVEVRGWSRCAVCAKHPISSIARCERTPRMPFRRRASVAPMPAPAVSCTSYGWAAAARQDLQGAVGARAETGWDARGLVVRVRAGGMWQGSSSSSKRNCGWEIR